MSLAFASLGSGSRGNALLVESARGLVMVDCGFSVKATVKWKNGHDLGALKGKPVRVRLIVKNADVYSMRFH